MIRKSFFRLLTVLILIMIVFWSTPRLLALYFLVKGSRILTNAEQLSGYSPANSFPCETQPFQNKAALKDVNQALLALESSVNFHPHNSYAYLLMGHIWCYLGIPENAIQYYSKYTTLHPKNPLGHIELAIAYEQVWQQWDRQVDNLAYRLSSAHIESPIKLTSLCA